MLKELKKSNNKGFTIIEVMIVLAIAGLIILVVLLAVPALQRNGRNTAMKNDASAIAGAVGEFKSNNDGGVVNSPTTDQNGPDVTMTNTTAGSAAAQAKIQTGSILHIQASATGPATYTAAKVNVIYVVPNAKCKGTNYSAATDLDVTTASKRSTSVIYPVEQRTGAPVGRCVEA